MVQYLAQGGGAVNARALGECGAKRLHVDQIELVRLVDRGLKFVGAQRPPRSISVLAGEVTGIWSRRVRSAAGRKRGWTVMLRLPRAPPRGTETSVTPGRPRRISQSAAALPWLSAASSPQHRTAAIQRPRLDTWGLPTAYTPRSTGCSRPVATRCLMACAGMPSSSNCARATTPCCLPASAHTRRPLGFVRRW